MDVPYLGRFTSPGDSKKQSTRIQAAAPLTPCSPTALTICKTHPAQCLPPTPGEQEETHEAKGCSLTISSSIWLTAPFWKTGNTHAKLEHCCALCGTQGLPFLAALPTPGWPPHPPSTPGAKALQLLGVRSLGTHCLGLEPGPAPPAMQHCASCRPLCLSFLACKMGQY